MSTLTNKCSLLEILLLKGKNIAIPNRTTKKIQLKLNINTI